MNLYQIVLEIYDGVNHYQEKQFVLAADDRSAARFVREFADTWRPNAHHDYELDLYSAPEGWPQWTLAQCAVVTQFTVPIAGKKHSAQVVLVPWENSFADMLRIASKLLSAVCDSSLADCSLRWVTQDHLNMSERALMQTFKAVIELQDRVASDTIAPSHEKEMVR